MIIDKYSVSLSARHEKQEHHSVSERLEVWIDGGGAEGRAQTRQAADDRAAPGAPSASGVFDFEAELSRISLAVKQETLSSHLREGAEEREAEGAFEDGFHGDTRLEVMKRLVEAFSGEKVSLIKIKTEGEGTEAAPDEPLAEPAAEERAGFGIEYDYKEVHVESETTRFRARGDVVTSDGRRIAFDVDMEMHRERVDVTQFSLRAGDAKLVDPLALNFGSGPVGLTEEKIDFDLNQDGAAERISFVRSGSGFLVLDRNRDGQVNDGGELFGPSTGDGFQELSQYDGDGNGWIDEADAVYADLRVWTRSGGVDRLRTLAESQVGAIYLGNAATPFDVKNSANQLDGRIQSSGVFLTEAGQVRTVQQVDLVT